MDLETRSSIDIDQPEMCTSTVGRRGGCKVWCQYMRVRVKTSITDSPRLYSLRPKINIILGPSTQTNARCKLPNCHLSFVRKI